MRRDEVERNLLVAVGLASDDVVNGLQVDRWAVTAQAFTKGDHPGVIQVEVLSTRQGAPRDQLMHIGIPGVVADLVALQARPGRAGNDLAGLRLNVAKADFFVLAVQRQMAVLAPGDF